MMYIQCTYTIVVSLFLDLTVTEESSQDSETFKGCVSYMAPARIVGEKKYGVEVDFWSLGIIMIEILTGNHPYLLRNDVIVLLSSIIQQPTPTLNESAFPKDLCDFVSACLNQAQQEKDSATTLLNHPFILAAKERGVISNTSQARLSLVPCPRISRVRFAPHELTESLVDIAVAWQLERWSKATGSVKTEELPGDLSSIRFSREHEAWLASQIHVDRDEVRSM